MPATFATEKKRKEIESSMQEVKSRIWKSYASVAGVVAVSTVALFCFLFLKNDSLNVLDNSSASFSVETKLWVIGTHFGALLSSLNLWAWSFVGRRVFPQQKDGEMVAANPLGAFWAAIVVGLKLPLLFGGIYYLTNFRKELLIPVLTGFTAFLFVGILLSPLFNKQRNDECL